MSSLLDQLHQKKGTLNPPTPIGMPKPSLSLGKGKGQKTLIRPNLGKRTFAVRKKGGNEDKRPEIIQKGGRKRKLLWPDLSGNKVGKHRGESPGKKGTKKRL